MNFRTRLQENRYPGRGLVQGLSSDGTKVYQLYWIMGRSANSRNRIFVAQSGTLETKAANPAELQDPSLVIYEAMLESGANYWVSNGDQTRTMADGQAKGMAFEQSLRTREREPDAPNFTPRISGLVHLQHGHQPVYSFSIIKANPDDTSRSLHHFFHRDVIAPGTGLALTTYEGDGQPLPSFMGEPFSLPLENKEQDILDMYWSALDAENRISLALKSIVLKGGVSTIRLINKHKSLG